MKKVVSTPHDKEDDPECTMHEPGKLLTKDGLLTAHKLARLIHSESQSHTMYFRAVAEFASGAYLDLLPSPKAE
jgi:hypothetical protein